jgi:hypothetical protein
VLLLSEDREKTPFGGEAVRRASRCIDSTDGLELADAHARMAALNRLPESASSLEALLGLVGSGNSPRRYRPVAASRAPCIEGRRRSAREICRFV